MNAKASRVKTVSTVPDVPLSRRLPLIVLGLAAATVLVLISRQNYLLFHSLIEASHIFVALTMFMVVWGARHLMRNDALFVMGTGYGAAGVLTLAHMLAYKGMGVFPPPSSNLATQFWIAACATEVAATLGALLALNRRVNCAKVAAAFGLSTTVLAALILTGHFPVCYVEGVGLTLFKKIAEATFCGLFLLGAVQLYRHRDRFNDAGMLLVGAAAINVGTEMAFMGYIDVYGLSNLAGHLLKAAAVVLTYIAIVRKCLLYPLGTLFRDLSESRDSLTGQLNGQREALAEANRQVQEERNLRQEMQARLVRGMVELECVHAELDRFSYVLAHDLQHPLHALKDSIAVLRKSHHNGLGADGNESLERTIGGIGQLQTLIQGLLDYSRTRREDLLFRPVELGEAVALARDELRAVIAETGASVTMGAMPAVRGDGARLQRLFRHLIDNALKFRQPGIRPDIAITATPNASGSVWEIAVTDNGIGMAGQDVIRIFEIFTRLDTDDRYPGIGMGLALCKTIVEHHGGRIWAESRPGQGSTIRFTLPAAA